MQKQAQAQALLAAPPSTTTRTTTTLPVAAGSGWYYEAGTMILKAISCSFKYKLIVFSFGFARFA